MPEGANAGRPALQLGVRLMNVGIIAVKELLNIMEWSTPQFEEVCLGCEIASYANPEI